MKGFITLFSASLLLFSSCLQTADFQVQLDDAREQLQEITIELQKAKEQTANLKVGNKKGLIHSVYIDLKEGISPKDEATFLKNLQQLEKVTGVQQLQVGKRTDTGDERAAKDYDVALEVLFADQAALALYQKDSFHLAIRKQLGGFIEGIKVYDFTTVD